MSHEQHSELDPKCPTCTGPDVEEHFRYFAYAHLPPHLQARSKPFAELAFHIIRNTPANAERGVALRKLIESKDAAVRAALP